MANHFARTLRALRADGLVGWSLKSLLSAALLAVWAAWFFLGRVTVYAVSDSARAEVGQQVYPVEAPVDGRVVSTRAELDLEVVEGEILIELDAREQEFRLGEERARMAGSAAQLAELDNQLAAERRALEEWLKASQAAIEEARARASEARTAAELAAEEEQRTVTLHERGLVSEMELVRARAEREQAAARAESVRSVPDRLALDRRAEEANRRAKLDNLAREAADLRSRIEAGRSTVARVERDQELRVLRAPATGRLGELKPLRAGSFVQEGDRLAVVVPSGRLKAVAEFEPAEAVGRVRGGQSARLRLAGFPSTQYGSIPASVARVASEARDGRIRVELDVHADLDSGIPLQHGMPGTVEVEVDRLSPAELVLRAVGKLLERPATGPGAGDGAGR